MKKMILGVAIGLGIGMLVNASGVKNCEFCGFEYRPKESKVEEICDSCFGWFEHEGSESENGVQIEFENGEGYYFESWKNK